MTDKPAGERPALDEEPQAPFVFRCTRCRASHETWDMQEHSLILATAFTLKSMVFCNACYAVLNEVRLPYLQQATDAIIKEVNQHHRDNPVNTTKAPVLGLVSTDKGEIH